MTVAENIAMAQGWPRRLRLIDWTRIERRARRALGRVGTGIDSRRRVGELGRTEKSLVAIARALATDADLLVLEDPTAGVDVGAKAGIHRLLGQAVGFMGLGPTQILGIPIIVFLLVRDDPPSIRVLDEEKSHRGRSRGDRIRRTRQHPPVVRRWSRPAA